MATSSIRERLISSGSNPEQLVDGITLLALHEAFERVQPAPNWKAPIDKAVVVKDGAELEAILRAVPFFTGGRATAQPLGRNAYRVKAAGYYASVGA